MKSEADGDGVMDRQPRINSREVMRMFAGLTLLLLQDALFLLGYLARGTAFPKPLSREEEARMIERMQAGDGEARASLIEHNLRLAAHIARKYTVPGYDADDLISIGTVGLIKGVNTYKPESGTQLSTYCARCIENEILMCLRASQKRRGDVSLQEPIGVDREGNEITLIDVLGTDGGEVHGEVERRMEPAKRPHAGGKMPAGTGGDCHPHAIRLDGRKNLRTAGGCRQAGHLPFLCFANREKGA